VGIAHLTVKSEIAPMTHLFEPLSIRDVTFRNRIAVAPMCQYSSQDGYANDWHLVHLTSRAVGGAGLVLTEAAAVEPKGRISPDDLGIWSDGHAEALAKIVTMIHRFGAVAGIQLAHAGRKASTAKPSEGGKALDETQGGWRPIVGPSAIAFSDDSPIPEALSLEGIGQITDAFVQAARRSLEAGFKVVEIHAAHGYLLHEFLSPLSNHREDEYGGSFENRTRLLREVVQAVREVWPEKYPLWVRISATDWIDNGWDIEQSIALSEKLKPLGVDLIDCSSGAILPGAKVPVGPGYQTLFAQRIRHEANIQTGAVGLITVPEQADHIIRTGQADVVLLAREMLRDPYWPHRAAKQLGHDTTEPVQYARAWD
jgi:2,4-dienoyl-CoA reductase-like NADH-dependent reductase (Old Yellow Enzyme family)